MLRHLRWIVFVVVQWSGIMVFAGQAPHLAYSDLVSGPASGGPGNQGSIVTVKGSGFGSTQRSSQVLLAGAPVNRILRWSDQSIAFQIGASARSGEIRVRTGEGESKGIAFAVSKGDIYCVSPHGSDSGAGEWSSPWRSLSRAVRTMKPGDIVYAMDGVRQTNLDAYNASLSIARAGVQGRPIAIVAYPGAIATIGDAEGPEFGLRTPSIRGGPFSDWVLAGFIIRGANTALRLNSVARWRIVGNDFSCPRGDGAAGCVEVSNSSAVAFLGNSVHDTGRPGGSKRYQAVYFTTDSNHIEVGWNRIYRNQSCRGIQFHSSPVSADSGFGQYDLLIHDNQISDQVCDGINLATIDPSKGRIAIYNNLIFHVGVGPAPPDGESSYTCISSPGIVNRGSAGSGTVEIYNNTLSDCGPFGGPLAGAFSVGNSSPNLVLKNNLIDQHGSAYFTPRSALSKVHGAANLWWGAGAGPRETNENLEAAPRFMSGESSYRLSRQSPAKQAAHDCPADYDIAGTGRNSASGCSIGAYE